jgi:predicted nucleotidyltransferase
MGTSKRNSTFTASEESALKTVKKHLLRFLGGDIVRIVLFGSRARGDFTEDSDIDIAVVVKNLSAHRKRGIFDIVAKIEFEYAVAVSILVFSLEDFEALRRRERRIVKDIMTEGVAL